MECVSFILAEFIFNLNFTILIHYLSSLVNKLLKSWRSKACKLSNGKPETRLKLTNINISFIS